MEKHIDHRHLMNTVQKILNRDWDPIEVAEVLNDEYDAYCAPITEILDDTKATQEQLSNYLEEVEREQMSLNAYSEQNKRRRATTTQSLWTLHISANH
ncbi:hypothetical protein B9T28_06555 [Acinetobacter silvestris]|uniref:Uncharacterized protein n=2 Tax=Acinetobacter silvestris TaxID=1977882 RepID=A0A1Y3CIC8_9GAMM|nr:hypothetical protein B9T28_06555 [Acinetobacter silvestris]